MRHVLERPWAGLLAAWCLLSAGWQDGLRAETLDVGFSAADITPQGVGERPVWLAGYGQGRRATGVHDPLMVRCIVLRDGTEKLALLSLDLVGLQLPTVRLLRARLKDYRYVLVASTHNHEGPDVIGIWGSSPLQRGVDEEYLELVIARCERAVRDAEGSLVPTRARYGIAEDESLLRDSREPYVKDGVLRAVRFERIEDGGIAGLLVQWNCHPETLGSRNSLVTADFPHFTVAALQQKLGCPVVYLSGAVGGLMTNPPDRFRDAAGRVIPDGTFAYAARYGEAIAQLAGRALQQTEPVELHPFRVASRSISIPVANAFYRAARELGVLRREEADGAGRTEPEAGVQTEVACLRLGELHLACIPGELYPELVYGKVPDPPEAGADFPEAPAEPSVAGLLPGAKWLLVGLANDEIGYLIPLRQWDERPPYCYGRKRPQYGETNSCGPQAAPLVMRALAECVAETARHVAHR